MAYVLQRGIRSEVGKSAWFDAERFNDRESALAARDFAVRKEALYAASDGRYSYTGTSQQPIRLVEVVA